MSGSPLRSLAPLERVNAWAYEIPTEGPEADGTFEWDSTSLVAVQVRGGGRAGIGYTYAHSAAALLVHRTPNRGAPRETSRRRSSSVRAGRERFAECAGGIDRNALAARLRSQVEGEVRFDGADQALYATDAGNYRHVPVGVVIPRTLDDVVETVATCREFGAPVLSRGGGTSIGGQFRIRGG